MFKAILLALGLTVSMTAGASSIDTVVRDINSVIFAETDTQGVFNWVVGDTASYNLKLGFISGKMVMTIKAVTATQVIMTQDMTIGGNAGQSCESTINSSTGQVEKMVCNGQEQDPGQAGQVEVIESKEDTIKVAAGTFTCLYIKAKSTVQDKVTEIEQWVNPKQIPVMGLVKAITPSQFGKVVLELASYKKM